MSACIGGGIVGIPFALVHLGIPLGTLFAVGVCALTFYSVYLLMIAKDMMAPIYVESLYELGFFSMGHYSIYLISSSILISLYGALLIYFILFGDICGSIVKELFYKDVPNA